MLMDSINLSLSDSQFKDAIVAVTPPEYVSRGLIVIGVITLLCRLRPHDPPSSL